MLCLQVTLCYVTLLVCALIVGRNAIPPEACFANFRWDDCGRPPVDVLYYWKPGSRCEVGVWRGCLPNLNMFKDEYECVATCIFTARAQPMDYHVLNAAEEIENVTTYYQTNATETEGINATSLTTVKPESSNSTTVAPATSVGNTTGTHVPDTKLPETSLPDSPIAKTTNAETINPETKNPETTKPNEGSPTKSGSENETTT